MITISNISEDLICKHFKNKTTYRIYNPTEGVEKQKFTSLGGNYYFIYVGRVDREKGVEYLVNEFKTTKEKLLIVGDGKMLSLLMSKKTPNIYFAGWRDHKTTIELIKHSKGLILPSLWYEGAPLTIFEALSLGRPCFVSNICAGKEFINNRNGWVFNPLINGELSKLINNVDSCQLEKKGEQAFVNFWNAPFSVDFYERKILELLDELSIKQI